MLKENKVNFKLAAPTGRAAKRMFQGTGCNTETLHRLLEFNPSVMGFKKNEQNALNCDFLIIDEASMIDVLIFCISW
ncbi:AAA family ATPase [Candidatus Dependentiae bacterium]